MTPWARVRFSGRGCAGFSLSREAGMARRSTLVAIIGAGIGGLAAALTLTRAGFLPSISSKWLSRVRIGSANVI